MNRCGRPRRRVPSARSASARSAAMGLVKKASRAAVERAETTRASDPLRPPLHRLHDQGLGGETAREVIAAELLLDGSARLNLATFVTTWMPDQAERLMAQTADKN